MYNPSETSLKMSHSKICENPKVMHKNSACVIVHKGKEPLIFLSCVADSYYNIWLMRKMGTDMHIHTHKQTNYNNLLVHARELITYSF